MKQTFFKYFLQAFLVLSTMLFSGCTIHFGEYLGLVNAWDINSSDKTISNKQKGHEFNLHIDMDASSFGPDYRFSGSFGYGLYDEDGQYINVSYPHADGGVINYGTFDTPYSGSVERPFLVSSSNTNVRAVFNMCMTSMVCDGTKGRSGNNVTCTPNNGSSGKWIITTSSDLSNANCWKGACPTGDVTTYNSNYDPTPCYFQHVSTDKFDVTSERKFTLRNPPETRNINGNKKVIGNTVLCNKHKWVDGYWDKEWLIGCCGIPYSRNIWIDGHWEDTGECIDDSSVTNADVYLSQINTTGDSSYSNASSATISDINDTAKVVWAGLYVQGRASKSMTETEALDYLQNYAVKLIDKNDIVTSVSPTSADLFYQYGAYSTFSEIPSLIGKTGAEIKGEWTVADLIIQTGKDTELSEGGYIGYYGAWSMVIIYEHKNESLKNISVFDGYQVVQDGNPRKINVTGFLTPTTGDIESELSIFVGEGDKTLTGDSLSLKTDSWENGDDFYLNEDNAFYSETNGFEPNPDLDNNFGIDIHNYDIGSSDFNYVKNGDSKATIEMASTGDVYFASMLAFTTELYQPRVCYVEEYLDIYGNTLENGIAGQTVIIKTTIANRKKDSNDTNLEDAKGVVITAKLNETDLTYISGTTEIKNVNENLYTTMTDDPNDNDLLGATDNNERAEIMIGRDATSTEGGLLKVNDEASMMFRATLVGGSINTTNEYTVAYTDDLLDLSHAGVYLQKCTDFNTSISVTNESGRFNVVNEGFTNGSDPKNDSDIALYTQVSNKNFNVKVISLDSNITHLENHTGKVNISIINTPEYSNDPSWNKNLCDTSVALYSKNNLQFSDQSIIDIPDIKYTESNTDLSFKITYVDDNDENITKHACSKDNFAIRPDSFALSAAVGVDLTRAVSAQDTALVISALNALKVVDNSYNGAPTHTVVGEFSHASMVGNASLAANASTNNASVQFDNVGPVTIQVQDRAWASVDDEDSTPKDCSSTGAYICGDLNITFVPASYTFSNISVVNGALNVDGTRNFSYFGDITNYATQLAPRGAFITGNVQALNANNIITTNFDTDIFAEAVEVSVAQVDNGANIFANIGSRIVNITANRFQNGTTSNINGGTPIAIADNLMFNLGRLNTSALNPTVINESDIHLMARSAQPANTYQVNQALNMTNLIVGTNANLSTTTFIYGRTHSPTQSFTGNTGTAYIFYESYCFGTDANGIDCAIGNLPNGAASNITDDPKWFVNTLHNTADSGSANNDLFGTTITRSNFDATTNPTTVDITNISGDSTYKTTAQHSSDSWLQYDLFGNTIIDNQFQVEFNNANNNVNWSGVNRNNNVKATTDTGARKTNRRTMW